MDGVVRGLDDHVVESEPGHGAPPRAGGGEAIARVRRLGVTAERGVEILDDPDLPVDGGGGRDAEDLRRALAFPAGAEGAGGLRVTVSGGGGGGGRVGLEVGRAASACGGYEDPTVEDGVPPDLGASIGKRRRRRLLRR